MASKSKGLLQRLSDGETVILAEGYLFEAERRGYLQAGAFVPEVVLQRPQLVTALYEEFVHAGSDVVLALTYYSHRIKLRLTGQEHLLEEMNRTALKLARETADKTGTLMAGNICNTTLWKPDDPKIDQQVHDIFKEQVEWAVQEGADFVLGETFEFLEEALIALECIKKYGKGIPAVVNLMAMEDAGSVWHRGSFIPVAEACQMLEAAGADVVGLNCHRGPKTMLPVIKEVKKAVQVPVACIPVPYRTSQEYPGMQRIIDLDTGSRAFPSNLEAWLCSRHQIAEFTKECKSLGIQMMGLCCGNMPCFTRTMAEALGRQPPASRYSPNMKQHLSQAGTASYEYANAVWQEKYPDSRYILNL